MTDEPSWTMAWRTGPTATARMATKATAVAASTGRIQPIRLGGGPESACFGCAPAAAASGSGPNHARAGATSRSRAGTTSRVRTDVTSRSRATVGQPPDQSRTRRTELAVQLRTRRAEPAVH
ncbi:MAG: hypothetical protein ABSA93_00605 [Streptosporangiaceae bacterium]